MKMHLYTIDTKTYITEKYNREINPAFDFDFDIHYILFMLIILNSRYCDAFYTNYRREAHNRHNHSIQNRVL